MTDLSEKLGKLSLAILENFVKSKLGEDFVKLLRKPTDRFIAVQTALIEAEKRFSKIIEFENISKAMFVDLSQSSLPSMVDAVGKFYDHPTEPELSEGIQTLILRDVPTFKTDHVKKAVEAYLEILTEELMLADKDFRENIASLAAIHQERALLKIIDRFNELIERLTSEKDTPPEKLIVIDLLHQLPSPPADFTGREKEIEQLVKDLTKGKGAAISGLAGMGGVGKTVLGLVVAHRIKDKYPDAQLFVDMQGTSPNPISPIEAMKQVILKFVQNENIQNYSDQDIEAAYCSILSEKRALLFLDNAFDLQQVKPLLPPPTCAVLVTSRRYFVLPGLTPIRLDVLTEEEALVFLLELYPQLGEQAHEIARLCGYLPIALRIAGNFLATNPDWTPAAYIAQLSERHERLAMLKSADDPELNVEAAISLSFEQLSAQEQVAWCKLSIFPASFRKEAVIQVWDLEEETTRALLSKLLKSSMLQYDPGTQRYALHDLLADFALSHLAPDAKEVAALLHSQHYLGVLALADDLYKQGAEHIQQGLTLFETEWLHIQAGQAWAAKHAPDGEQAKELCAEYPNSGVYILSLRLDKREWIQWLETALLASRSLGDRRGEGAALGNLGLAYAALGEARKAIEYYEKQMVITSEIGDRRGEGAALGNLGIAYAALGETRKAIEYYEKRIGYCILRSATGAAKGTPWATWG